MARLTSFILPKSFLIILLAAFYIASFSNTSLSQEASDCPKSIAVIANNPITLDAGLVIKDIYKKLGCTLELKYFPGRRGIIQFNHKMVDGEVFRLKRAEPLYERGFVSSATPIFSITNSLWMHPNPENIRTKNIGYILGIVWQEQYQPSAPKKAYHGIEKIFEAYNASLLTGFLSTNYNIIKMNKAGLFTPPPALGKTVNTAPVYHYLGKEFTPFMKRFSKYIEENSPFADFDTGIQ